MKQISGKARRHTLLMGYYSTVSNLLQCFSRLTLHCLRRSLRGAMLRNDFYVPVSSHAPSRTLPLRRPLRGVCRMSSPPVGSHYAVLQRESGHRNADDGYINAPLSVALRILVDLKQVFKEDAGLELNMLKTQLLVKGISNHDAYSAAKGFFENDACLSSIKDTITLASFTAEGYVGLGPWH